MKFPIIELVDRYAVAAVKSENTHGENFEELQFYQREMQDADIDVSDELILALIEHHRFVWSLEDDFKKCRIDNLPLEEIGRRAIIIRDAGFNRFILKNKIAEKMGDTIKEVKNYFG
jgi:hypothetical protein